MENGPHPAERPHLPLSLLLGVALALGLATGVLLGPAAKPLGALGPLVVKLLKCLATPLIFFAVADALLKTDVRPRSGLKLLAISTTNALVAAAIALTLVNALPLGKAVQLETLAQASTAAKAPEPLDATKVAEAFVPSSVLEPFVANNALGAVVLSLLLGAALKRLRDSGRAPDECATLERAVSGGMKVLALVLEWVVRLVPIAAFGVVAAAVGEKGLAVFATLGAFVLLVTAGLALHALAYYSLVIAVVARRSPLVFFKEATEALLTAFSCGSSLATLPVTLRTLDSKMRVSPANARLAACVGTNLNHDGILLYEAVAALFVAQVYGRELALGDQLQVALTSTLAAVGIAGVPDAGLITLSLVLGSAGLPLSAAPLLLPVDWFLGRLRATVNVTSDLVVANVLERLEEGKDAKLAE
jgi:DAACS family dicarboxylate/amino acid:cation (Na+ or H+) symporter